MSRELAYDIDDNLLISSLAKGDSKAIQYIYKKCYPSVEKMVFKMNGTTDDAFDVFQDAVTVLYEKLKKEDLQLQCKTSTYLIAIAKHIWLKKISKKKKQISIVYDESERDLHIDDDYKQFEDLEKNMKKLKTCFEQIGDPCKSLLTAFYIQNKSMNEIATSFGYTNSENAKTQKYKCLNRMRKLFFTEQEKEKTNERLF